MLRIDNKIKKQPYLIAAFLLCSTRVLFAQDTVADNLPLASTPDVISTEIHEEISEDIRSSETVPKFEIEKDKYQKFVEGSISFKVKDIELRFHEDFESDIDPRLLIEGYLNKEVTFNDITALAQEIEVLYLKEGYIVVVNIPPQKLKDGQMFLEVIASRMGDLYFDGNMYSKKELVESYWLTPSGFVLKYQDIEESLRLMNKNPDRSAATILKSGKDKGLTDVHVVVEEKSPIHWSYSIDNYGAKLTGKRRHSIIFQHNNLLGYDDRFTLGTVVGEEFGVLVSNYYIPIGKSDWSIFIGGTYAQVNPKKEFSIFGINGISYTYNVDLQKNIKTTDRFTSDFYIGFDVKEKRTRVLSEITNRDRLRMASTGIRIQAKDKKGIWFFGQDLHLGLPAGDERASLRSRGSGSEFFRYEFNLRRYHVFSKDFQVLASFDGQVSSDRLTPSEQLFLGGPNNVRGYPPSDYGADKGFKTSIELQTPFRLIPQLKEGSRFFVFLDYGFGRINEPVPGEIEDRSLLGTGIGLNLKWSESIQSKFELSFPIGDPGITESGDERLDFSVNIRT